MFELKHYETGKKILDFKKMRIKHVEVEREGGVWGETIHDSNYEC